MISIIDVRAIVREIPLRHDFATAQDNLARHTTRPICIDLLFSDGSTSNGESVPVHYVTGETETSYNGSWQT